MPLLVLSLVSGLVVAPAIVLSPNAGAIPSGAEPALATTDVPLGTASVTTDTGEPSAVRNLNNTNGSFFQLLYVPAGSASPDPYMFISTVGGVLQWDMTTNATQTITTSGADYLATDGVNVYASGGSSIEEFPIQPIASPPSPPTASLLSTLSSGLWGGLVVGPGGYLYAVSQARSEPPEIRKIDPSQGGLGTDFYDFPDTQHFLDGQPAALAADATSLWLEDSANLVGDQFDEIDEVSLAGATFVRSIVPSQHFVDQGLVSAGTALYATGNDYHDWEILRIDKVTGVVTSVAGGGDVNEDSVYDGTGQNAGFGAGGSWTMFGVASDGSNLWTADAYMYSADTQIRELSPAGPSSFSTAAYRVPNCGVASSSEGATAPAHAFVADPIDTATGDQVESSTDVSVPGPGVPLSFTRTYDAQLAQAEATDPTDDPPGALGYGWSDNLGLSIDYNSTTGIATLTGENCAQDEFQPSTTVSASEQWCTNPTAPVAGSYVAFCPPAARELEYLWENTGSGDPGWILERDVTGIEYYYFHSDGQLYEIKDEAGDTLTANVSAPVADCAGSGVSSCTTWTSSSSSRYLALGLDSGNRVVSADVDGDTTSGSFASYSYSGADDLVSAQDPSQGAASYTYCGTASSQYCPGGTAQGHDLASWTLPGQSTATQDTYDSSGQVTQQVDPAGTTTSLTFTGNNLSATSEGNTVVTVSSPSAPTETTQYDYLYGFLVGEQQGSGSTTVTDTWTRDPSSGLVSSFTDGDHNKSTNDLPGQAAGLGAADVSSAEDGTQQTSADAYEVDNKAWCAVAPAEALDEVYCPSAPPSMPAAGAGSVYTTANSSTYGNVAGAGPTLTYYDGSGRVVGSTDARGYTSETAYNSAGLPWCSVDAEEYSVRGVSCPSTPLTSPPTGTAEGFTTTIYDAKGDVTSVTDPDGATTSYGYTSSSFPWVATVVTDPAGTVTTKTLDSAGRVIKEVVTDAANSYRATTIEAYDSAGRLYCTIAPLAYSQGTTSCPAPEPSTYTPPHNPANDPFLGATATIYDQDGRPIYQINPIGGVTETAYDNLGQVWCSVSALDYSTAGGGYACPSAPPSSPPTQSSDPDRGMTVTSYNSAGEATQVTNPLGGITLTAYDGAGNVASSTLQPTTGTGGDGTGLQGVVTTYQYDPDNRVDYTKVGSGSDATISTESYDPNGHVYCSISAKDQGTGPCPAWQAAWVSPPSPSQLFTDGFNEAATSFTDADGNVVQSTDADVTASGAGDTTLSAFDADGRTYCTVDATNVAKGTTCPATAPTSPPATGSDPGYSTTIYDPAGKTISTSDQLGDTTTDAYDAAGQLSSVTDPDGNVTVDCYYTQSCAAGAGPSGGSPDDVYRQVLPSPSSGHAGVTTTYSDLPGGLQGTKATAGSTETDQYDAIGDLTQKSFVTSLGYAELNLSVAYSYFVDGSRQQMTDDNGATTYSQDALGDVLTENFSPYATTSMVAQKVSQSFYSNGDLEQVTYPGYGSFTGSNLPSATYSYDDHGNMASVSDWLNGSNHYETSFATDGDGNLTNQTSNAGIPAAATSTTFGFDSADRPTGTSSTYEQSCGGTVTLAQSYSGSTGSLNPDGQLTTETDSAPSTSCSAAIAYSRGYSYDQAGRLVYQGSGPQGANPNNIAYDPAGNPTTLYSENSSGTYASTSQSFNGAEQLSSQTTSGATTNYAYDGLGDQTTATNASTGAVTSTYGYDGLGEMISDDSPQSTSQGNPVNGYLYNGNGLLAASLDLNGDQSWNQSSVDGTRTITGVSCAPGTMYCVLVDASGYAVVKDAHWGTPSQVDTHGGLMAVDCLAKNDCLAVDNDGNAFSFNGTSWTMTAGVDGTRDLTGLSCEGFGSPCVAVDSSGNAVIWTASGGWGTVTSEDTHGFTGVSCVVLACVAVDNHGNALTYSSSGWSTSDIDGTTALNAISCANESNNFCVAVDGQGNALAETDSGTWSSDSIDPGTSLTSVSCPTVTFCMAGDTSGNSFSFNGISSSSVQEWSPPEASFSGGLAAISCSSEAWCLAALSNHKGDLFSPPATQLTWSTGNLPEVLSDGNYDYVYGPSDEPIEAVSLSSPTPTFLVYSPKSDSWLATNASGHLVSYYRYDAFGSPVVPSLGPGLGSPATPFGFAGQYTDSPVDGALGTNSGLVNMRARWYQPGTGQFTSVDPEVATTDASYSYAADDPINRSDPNGLSVDLGGVAAWAFNNVYSAGNDGYTTTDGDCTDFVSRALHFGGNDPENLPWYAPIGYQNDQYWYRILAGPFYTQASYSWAAANHLAHHLQLNGSQWLVDAASSLPCQNETGWTDDPGWADVQPGDVAFADFHHGSSFSGIDHAGVVTSIVNGEPYITQHGPAQPSVPISFWLNYRSNTHVWIVQPSAE